VTLVRSPGSTEEVEVAARSGSRVVEAVPVVADADTGLPRDFDEYRVMGRLGAGGMGEVFVARDTLLDRLVAIKLVSGPEAGERERARFLLEARAAARIQHPNVVTVHRVGLLGAKPYLVSELVRGVDLDEMAKPVPWPRALELATGLARGLAAAHRQGVLHRDLKPANAILAEDGTVKLLDFGLAKLIVACGGYSPAPPRSHRPSTPPPPSSAPGRALQRSESASARSAAPGNASRPATSTPAPIEALARPPALEHDGGESVADPSSLDAAVTMRAEPPAFVSASPVTRPGTILGTPWYIPPEVWHGEPATRRSDVYSMGALIFELCTGHPPFEEASVPDLARAVTTRRAPALASIAAIDPRFAAIVDRCLAPDPEERFASGEELCDALAALVQRDSALPVPEGNPYRGLAPFEAEHRALFAGRAAETRVVVERLRSDPFVLVVGDSGVGKSSLCRAGVLPSLASAGLEDGRRWSTSLLVPGRDPLGGLAAIAPGADDPTVSAPEVARRLSSALTPGTGLALLVDPLDDVLRPASAPAASRFCEILAGLAAGVPGVRLVATLRADFLAALAAEPALGAHVGRALYLLRPLDAEATREAIVAPATATGMRFESEETVDQLVEGVAGEAGSLPLLEFALAELWRLRDRTTRTIPAGALAAIGGVSGALARHADEVLRLLDAPGRAAARRVLLRLVSPDGASAPRAVAEVATRPDERAVLEALVRGRLVAIHEADGRPIAGLSHELLLRWWDTLRGWVEDRGESRFVRQRLQIAVTEWTRVGRSRDALWGGRQLDEARALGRDDLSADEDAFLRASRARVRGRRAGVAVLSFLFVAAAASAWVAAQREARATRDARVAVHVGRARSALSDAREDLGRRRAAEAQSFASFDAAEPEPGEAAWARARSLAAHEEAALAGAGRALEAAIALDPESARPKSMLAEVLWERAALAEWRGDEAAARELAGRMALYDREGARVRAWNAPGAVRVTTPGDLTARVSISPVSPSRRVGAVRVAGPAPLEVELPAGAWILTLDAPDRVPVRLPFVLSRGERLPLDVPLPRRADVPRGMVFVPAGRFRSGTAADEALRRWMRAEPLRSRATAAFLIGRTEVTWDEWLAFLESLPADERARRTPRVGAGSLQGSLSLERGRDGRTELRLQPSSREYRAARGEHIRYDGRSSHAAQDWSRMPVSGIDASDAEAYAGWLDRTGRLPGARLCTEREWERAARGADGRAFPHGDALAPGDANFDRSHGQSPESFGPDEVGAHPAGRSPFGLDDMAGNVAEWTRAERPGSGYVLRGGSYYFDATVALSANREPAEPDMRDLQIGLRVCANAPVDGRAVTRR